MKGSCHKQDLSLVILNCVYDMIDLRVCNCNFLVKIVFNKKLV